MRTRLTLAILLLCATRTALAATCGGFTIVPADHVLVKYSAALPAGATHSTPIVSTNGFDVAVTRSVSGGSSIDTACVDDTIDLGVLGAGRFNVTWSDNSLFGAQRAQFAFSVAGAFTGSVLNTTLIPPAVPDQPVRLELDGCSSTPAVAYVAANNRVNVIQYGNSSSLCRLYVLDLGILAAGRYDVVTQRVPGPPPPTERDFSFIVQQPPPSSTCGRGFFVERTPAHTVHLHFEDWFTGYAPSYGPPTASELIVSDPTAYSITVTQPVSDTANAALPGAAPASTLCHAEDLDLGALPDGYYSMTWADLVNILGADAGNRVAVPPPAFRLTATAPPCTSTSALLLPAGVVSGEKFAITRSKLDTNAVFPLGVIVSVSGNVITVNERLAHEGPISSSLPPCYRMTAKIDGLPAGQYTVIWSVMDNPGSGWRAIETIPTSLNIDFPKRQRAARH